jgi:hypothetical protein
MQNLDRTLEALATRVAKLEAQNRRLKRVAISVLLVVTAVVTMGQAKKEEPVVDHIRARSIDADLIQLSDGGKDGATTLLLPGRILIKMKKNALVSLSAWQENGPSVVVTDEAGYSARLGKSDLVNTNTGRAEKTSAASLVLFGKDQKVLWSVP